MVVAKLNNMDIWHSSLPIITRYEIYDVTREIAISDNYTTHFYSKLIYQTGSWGLQSELDVSLIFKIMGLKDIRIYIDFNIPYEDRPSYSTFYSLERTLYLYNMASFISKTANKDIINRMKEYNIAKHLKFREICNIIEKNRVNKIRQSYEQTTRAERQWLPATNSSNY